MKLFEVKREKLVDVVGWPKSTESMGFAIVERVAEGVEFTNGKCIVQWRGKIQSTVVYDSMDDLKGVMCSNPQLITQVEYLEKNCNCSKIEYHDCKSDSDLESEIYSDNEDNFTLDL